MQFATYEKMKLIFKREAQQDQVIVQRLIQVFIVNFTANSAASLGVCVAWRSFEGRGIHRHISISASEK